MTNAASDVASTAANDRQHRAPARLRGRREPVFRHPGRAQSRHRPATRIAGTARRLAIALHKNEKAPQKSDVGVRITSQAVTVGPDHAGDPQLPRLRRSQDGRRSAALSRRGAGDVPQEPVDPAGTRHRPVRDHADAEVHVRRHRAGRPFLGYDRATTASRSSC